MKEELLETMECSVCREALQVVRVKADRGDRIIAREIESGERHVCFDIPADANLLVLEDW